MLVLSCLALQCLIGTIHGGGPAPSCPQHPRHHEGRQVLQHGEWVGHVHVLRQVASLSLYFLQLLEEICQKSSWGSPIYSLHSSTSTTVSGEPDTLFLYKATIVGIGMTYIPSKLCRNLSEAREIAAEHALIQLGYPMEGEVLPRAPWKVRCYPGPHGR